MSRRADPQWKPRSELRLINTDVPRVDGPAKVSGRAKYAHDVRLPNMVYARLFLCPHPSAEVVSVDVEAAKSVPGVAYAAPIENHPTRTMFLGQPLAVVAGETPEAAEDGLRAIRASFEEAEWVVTPEQSAAEGAPQITTRQSNAFVERDRGDAAAVVEAAEGAAAFVDRTYTVPVQHHCCLETHGMVIDFDGERARCWLSTQAVTSTRDEVARALGLRGDTVEIICDYMGGGFGSKFSIGIEGVAACQVARDLRRPVHLMLTRSDEFLIAGNRSGGEQRVRAGASADGKLVAIDSDIWRHGGLGRGSNPGLPYIYAAGTASMRLGSVRTNTDANRAMRAPGHPQASFAMESVVDELAYAIGMDPLEFRIKNLEDPVYHRQLNRVAQEIGWYDHPYRTAPGEPGDGPGAVNTGIGFGVSTWGGGGREVCVVTVRIDPDGSVTSSAGSQDLGTGVRTYVASIVAEELGLEIHQVVGRVGHSEYGPSNASGGSTTTGSLAPAVKDAAHNARVAFSERLASWLDCGPDDVVFEGGQVRSARDERKRLSWSDACSILGSDPLVATGEWRRHLQGEGVHGAQAVKVEVDVETGRFRLVKMVCIQDQGLPVNRLTLRSQINGGMVEAIGYAMFEERVIDPWLGVALNANFDDYKLPGSTEMPEMVAIIDDDDERQQTIGMAEATIIPGHGAIANAIHNACGVRIRNLPLTPDKILMGLQERA
ncbi:MAG: xanthine dehydrogenase family protein molybdopterin-binding subunit [Planctomycetota bacterium]|jgi:xanthine dehydrogenase YagR molybdenum-binding subunit